MKKNNWFRGTKALTVVYDYLDMLYKSHYVNSSCDGCTSLDDKVRPICCAIQNEMQDLDSFMQLMKALGTTDNTKICDYFTHWLYGIIRKSKITDSEIYNLYEKMKDILKDVCNYENTKESDVIRYMRIYDRNVLKDKRELYDFLEYYNNIKKVLSYEKPINKDEYCRYIKYIFNLYQKMAMNNYKELYNMETDYFKEIFEKADEELNFLENKCFGEYLYLIFDKEKRVLRDLKEEKKEQLVGKKTETCDSSETDSVENSPYDKHEYKDVLKDFSSYTVYEKLNNSTNIGTYCSDCKDVSNLESQYKGIKQFCKKLARNLRNKLSDINDTVKNEDDRCLYFIYWAYDKIREIYNGRIQNIHEIPLFSKILGIAHGINYELAGEVIRKNVGAFKGTPRGNSTTSGGAAATQIKEERFVRTSELSTYKPCFFYLDCTLDECNEMKDLFDYFKNYDSIKGKKSTDGNKHEQCCKYLTYINGLYEKNISNCCVCFQGADKCREDCLHYFQCDQLYNPHNLYDEFNCSSKIPGTPFKKVNLPEAIDFYSKDITEKSKKKEYLPRVDYFTPNSTQEMQDSMPKILDSVPKILDSMPHTLGNILESDPFYTIVLGAFTLLGILCFFFIFYKFTPVGSLFHRKKSRQNREIYDFHDMYMGRPLHGELEFPNENAKRGRLHISYQSA
ncbi:VIR protein [Plasmodium vivax]|uniref:VIR protein n=1 Tax=Plasmodium vivax TaxID=5855 RepID=A0A1G4H0K7_PLAVI|nr:VIR protein [Plasmodium vivax]